MRVVSIYNVKGGVGKSVVATNLSCALRKLGNEVCHVEGDTLSPTSELLHDFEPTQKLGEWLCGQPKGLTIIDLGPGAGDLHTTALSKTDLVILVTTADPASVMGTVRAARKALSANPMIEFAVVVNRAANKQAGRRVAARVTRLLLSLLSQDVVFFVVIPESGPTARATLRRQLLSQANPKVKALTDYSTLASAVTSWQKIDEKPQFLPGWRSSKGQAA